MKTLIILFLAIVWSSVAQSSTFRFVDVDAQMRLIANDGTGWRLAGIEIVKGDPARLMLEQFAGREWSLRSDQKVFDRWGFRFVQPISPNGSSLQSSLLAKGFAVCRPDLANGCDPADWIIEQKARSANLGFWSQAPKPARRAQESAGQYALISGRVLHAQEARRYVYLNFGEVWKTDFTVRVPVKLAKKFAKADLDLLSLEGRDVEIRGFVFEENGPMIEMREAAALEVLE